MPASTQDAITAGTTDAHTLSCDSHQLHSCDHAVDDDTPGGGGSHLGEGGGALGGDEGVGAVAARAQDPRAAQVLQHPLQRPYANDYFSSTSA